LWGTITKSLNNTKIMQGSMNATALANPCIKNKSFKFFVNLQVSGHDTAPRCPSTTATSAQQREGEGTIERVEEDGEQRERLQRRIRDAGRRHRCLLYSKREDALWPSVGPFSMHSDGLLT
jgi:hypothetical protein